MCRNVLVEVPAKDTIPAHKVISPVANPWLTTTMRNTLNTIAPGSVEFSRTMAVAWQETKKEFTDNVLEMEDMTFKSLRELEGRYSAAPDWEKRALLDNFTSDIYSRCAARWNELEARYWLKFGRGF